MSLLDKVTKLEKQLERLAARDDVPLEPVEIRRAILDEIEEQVQPAGRSKRVFPFSRVAVDVVATDGRRRAAIEAVLGGDDGLREAVAERLREAGCSGPAKPEVRVRFVRKPAPAWTAGRPFLVSFRRDESAPDAGTAVGSAAGGAQVVVLKGVGTHRVYTLAADRTNIGRTAEVLDRDSRVARRNEVVFAEGRDPSNETVSRAQAHIRRMPTGEYRLYDDRSAHGTRIFRGGQTIALPSGSPRGVKLQHGDEVYFGQACVRFEVRRTP